MHTIKGNARVYGLNSVTNVVHHAEQTYDKLRRQEAEWDNTTLLEELDESRKSIDLYHNIYNEYVLVLV